KGHIKAVEKIASNPGLKYYNLGTGNGYSVLDIIKAFSEACGHDVPYVFAPRRPGDIDECYADPSYAAADLGWKAELDLKQMCADSWRWQSGNPEGYR
ncbi:MAG: GDP-mannose 4,6-dehydratase, partial [Parasporobacterium sp.]|nr:GDP-mannose 4,6-dehydratase [Parasporobacterium sp.]